MKKTSRWLWATDKEGIDLEKENAKERKAAIKREKEREEELKRKDAEEDEKLERRISIGRFASQQEVEKVVKETTTKHKVLLNCYIYYLKTFRKSGKPMDLALSYKWYCDNTLDVILHEDDEEDLPF